MSFICSIVNDHKEATKTGDMWKAKNIDHWLVILPNGAIHDIHGISTDGTPWNVTGEAPRFTVSPSINHKSGWHGWLEDGVLKG